MPTSGGLPRPTIIEPVDLGDAVVSSGRAAAPGRRIAMVALLLLVATLGVAGWFVLSARQVTLTFAPAAERVDLAGPWPRLRIGERYLLRYGEYRVDATRAGHHPLSEAFTVAGGGSATFDFPFKLLPGLVTVRCTAADEPDRALAGVAVRIDEAAAGPAPLEDLAVEPGVHRIALTHDRYQPQEHEITVDGAGARQSWTWVLRPDWAVARIASQPSGARVSVNGAPAGTTPCEIDLPSGPQTVAVTADGFRAWTQELAVVAEEPIDLTDIVLAALPGHVRVRTVPAGAQVMIDETYAGLTPLTADAPPDRDVRVRVTRDGYEPGDRLVRVASGETVDVAFELALQRGAVRLEVDPPDARLRVDDVDWGVVPSEITLSAVEHELVFSRPGFEPETRTVRPRPGLADRLAVTLTPIAPGPAPVVEKATAANGYALVPVGPATFEMGASRREQGRRSNETLRRIKLTRPVLMGVHEVTNADYRAFAPGHQSGTIGPVSLGGADRPVVQVTWHDAARYCNWLSQQDGLPPAYAAGESDTMVAVTPMTVGYRLPTEAEWEYAGRGGGEGPLRRYPWGGSFPPREKSGNYADESAASILNRRIPDYDDAYAASAPVGTFPANDHGLFDMGGNVAEWCHDYYAVHTYDASAVAVDPLGPEEGQHHAVRGSSWRHASISALRLSYRDYSQEKRDDLGFRVCRYVPLTNMEFGDGTQDHD